MILNREIYIKIYMRILVFRITAGLANGLLFTLNLDIKMLQATNKRMLDYRSNYSLKLSQN